MYSNEDLNRAVDAGVLSATAADAFRHFTEQQRQITLEDEEQFRLVTGFNDIFVVIAGALALIALWTLGEAYAPWLGGALVLAGSWVLSEYFTRKRRMALPSIVFVGSAIVGTFLGAMFTFVTWYMWNENLAVMVSAALAVVVALVHWRRFQVPITLAFLTATAVACLMGFINWYFEPSDMTIRALILAAGIVVFFIAYRWDKSDTQRQTRRSDIAFWLHLLAAPLLVHPIFVTISDSSFTIGLTQAIATIVLYLVLCGVSLIIDRRALMVSALSYVVYVFTALLTSYGVIDLSLAIIGLTVGTGLLLLSVFWHRARAALVRLSPASIQSSVPPID